MPKSLLRDADDQDDIDKEFEEELDDESAIALIDRLQSEEMNVPIETTTNTITRIETESTINHVWKGFKLIGDNIDKNIRRSFQTIDSTTLSLHYFHTYALLDRVDFSGLSDEPRTGEIDFNMLIPSKEDVKKMKDIFIILVSRYVFMKFYVLTIIMQ